MVVKITDPKPHKSVIKKVICKNCGVTVEYTPHDLKENTYRDYSGDSDTYFDLECPKCKFLLVHNRRRI